MREGSPKPSQSRENQPGPRPELPLREVYKLPSQAIVDGVYAGRIGTPEALRAYFIRQRTEFLQQHPNGEATLDKPGPIGRWHGLVHSDTAEEYSGLASFAEGEVHRRTAGLSDGEAQNSAHLQGVANFRRIADVWRQRAARLSEAEEPTPSPERFSTPSPAAELTPERERQTRTDYGRLQDYEVLDGINNGTLTKTEAVHVYVR